MDYNIEEIVDLLNAALQENNVKATPIPAPLILFGTNNKKGLSAREMAKEIITRQQEAGAPIGALDDGSDSISEKMELIRVEVILKHLLQNAIITVVVPPGTPIQGQGISATGAPVQVVGTTTSYAIGKGIIQ